MKFLAVVLFLGLGSALTNIAPAVADNASPVVPVNASSKASLLPQQIRITKYPGDNTSFKIETFKGLVIITDPCDMNEEVQPDIVTISHSHDDHADFSHLKGPYQLLNTVRDAEIKGVRFFNLMQHDQPVFD